MKLSLKLLAFLSAAALAHDIEPIKSDGNEMELDCPLLECEENALEGNKCYQHDGNASASKIKGSLCYDVESAKQTDQKLVCPFNTHEYMWVDEILQGQQRNEQ